MTEAHTVVNRLELASELADIKLMAMQNEALENNIDKLPFTNGIVKEDENGDVVYTEEAQEMFNVLYAKYETMILNCEV